MAATPGPDEVTRREKRTHDGVEMVKGGYKFDFYIARVRFRPTLRNMSHNQATFKAMAQLSRSIKQQIREGTFRPSDHFPNYEKLPELSRLCGERTSDVPFSFKEAAKAWITVKQSKWTAGTLAGYESDLKNHWYPIFGHRALTSISDVDVMKYRNTGNFNAKTWNNWLVPLRGVFKYAHKKGWITSNPLTGLIENEKVQKEDPTPFTVPQALVIVDALRRITTEGDANYYEFAFATGMRTAELIALLWEKIDLVKGTALVNVVRSKGVDRPSTKTWTSRTVKLTPRAQAVLMRQRSISGLAGKHVFLRYNGQRHLDYNLLYKAWIEALPHALIDGLPVPYRGPYSTRASSITWRLMLAAETPAKIAQQHGHAPEEMFASYYSYIDAENDEKELRLIESYLNDSPKIVPNALRSKFTFLGDAEKVL